MKQVSFLSCVISEEGISVDSTKIQNMLSWNAPASVADIHSLLGLVGYYWRLVKEFLRITKLLRKDKKFKWTPAYEVSF
jgi:hypothetical protein